MTTVGSVSAQIQPQQAQRIAPKKTKNVANAAAVQGNVTRDKLPTPSAKVLRANAGVDGGSILDSIFKKHGFTKMQVINICSNLELGIMKYLDKQPKEKATKILQDMSSRLGLSISPDACNLSGVIKALYKDNPLCEGLFIEGKLINAFCDATKISKKTLVGICNEELSRLSFSKLDNKSVEAFFRYSKCAEQELAMQKDKKGVEPVEKTAVKATAEAEVKTVEGKAVTPLKTENVPLKTSLKNTKKATKEAANVSQETFKKVGTHLGKKLKETRIEKEALVKSLSRWKWGAGIATALAVGVVMFTGKKEPKMPVAFNQQM